MTYPWVGTSSGRKKVNGETAASLAVLIAVLALILYFGGCSGSTIGYTYSSASWPTQGGDVQRTGALGAEAHPPFFLKWKADAGLAPVGHLAVLEDAIAGCFLRRTVALYALDSGRTLWRRNLRTDPSSGPSASDGLMYLSTDIPEGRIQCLHIKDGKTLWWSETGETDGAPTAANGFVYACARNGRLLRLGPRDGKIHWRSRVAQLGGASPAVVSDIGVVTTLGDSVVAFRPDTGETSWRYQAGSAQFGSAAVKGGRCYLSANEGLAVCLELESGKEIWRRPLGGRSMSSPAVREGSVYFTDLSGRLSCFDAATGETTWETAEDAPLRAGPAVTSYYVYTAGMGGRVSCYDRETGEPLWTQVMEESFETPPVIAEMYLVVVSSEGTIYCFKEEIR